MFPFSRLSPHHLTYLNEINKKIKNITVFKKLEANITWVEKVFTK
jgi:hypothetical protein